MASKYSVTLKIDPELQRLLQAPEATIRPAMQEAMQYASEWFAGRARANAPIDNGDLRKSITYTIDNYTLSRVGTKMVYARIQEYGGTVVPKNKQVLAWIQGRRPPFSPADWAAAKQNGTARFAKHVRIPAKLYFKRTVVEAQQYIYKFYIDALQKILGHR